MNAQPHHPRRAAPERPRIPPAVWLTAAACATALWFRSAGKRAEKHHPPQGRFIEFDGVRLHYLDYGSGPPVVLLHGNGAMAADFAGCGLVETLAAHHRVIAFDRPGFGYSTRPGPGVWTAEDQAALLARACAALGAGAPIVLGHSWGTLVAIALALRPDIGVRGLVLVSGYYYPTWRLDAVQGTPRLPLIGTALRYTVSPLLSALSLPGQLRLLFSPHEIAPEFRAAVPPALMLRPWQLKASAEESALLAAAAARLAPHYAELRMPVEIFAGRDDRYVKQADQSLRLHRELPHSTLHLLSGEGHMLHYRAPARLADAVERIAQDRPASTPEAAEAPLARA